MEDKYRMERLFEEVVGRLHEMAAITSRSLGLKLPEGYRILFVPEGNQDAAAGKAALFGAGPAAARYEIVCHPDGGPCGYYDLAVAVCNTNRLGPQSISLLGPQ
jgi:hypothetical protein